MKTKSNQKLLITFFFLAGIVFAVNAQNTVPDKKNKPALEQKTKTVKYKVTFIELGSVRCIPCQKMQPIMKSVKEKYPDQVNVIFYDVWTSEGRPYAQKYGVQVIPTQVFLDETGKEFYRHEGYFPEEELVKVLKAKGVK